MSTARVDTELVRRGLARSRADARRLVAAGSVRVGGSTVGKPSSPVPPGAEIVLAGSPARWVGRGAEKLSAALEAFGPAGLEVTGRRCLDVGASTGGFTEVLLGAGAVSVVALDVGHGQLAPALAADPRVTDRSGRNIRDVAPGDLGPAFDVVVVDVSFVPLRLVVPRLPGLLAEDGDAVVLVKPQFEAGRARVGRSGVVRAVADRLDAVREVCRVAADVGLRTRDVLASPLPGAAGNREYLVWMTRRDDGLAAEQLERRIAGMGKQ